MSDTTSRGVAPWSDLAIPPATKPALRSAEGYCRRCAKQLSRWNPHDHCWACQRAAAEVELRAAMEKESRAAPAPCPGCGGAKLHDRRLCWKCRRAELNGILEKT